MATKDYEAIAKERITTPGKMARKPRILIYGRNKKGKTRLGSSAPNTLVIDPEGGTIAERPDLPVWPVNSWDDLNEVYHYLKGGKHPYEWVNLDGITKIANMGLRWVMSQQEERDLSRKPGFVDRGDYGKSNEMVKAMLTNFHSLRSIGLIITAQERTISIENMDPVGEVDDEATPAGYLFVPDLPNGARTAVNEIVDVIGRIYTVQGTFPRRVKRNGKIETIEEEGVQRRLWVQPHDSYDTGYRSQFVLPPYFKNPTVPKLISAMQKGKASTDGN